MSTATLLPLPRFVAYDTNGNPLAGGFVNTYVPGGTTPKTSWQDAGQTTPNENPIPLDANGSCSLYGSGSYQLTVTDALGNAVPAYSGIASLGISPAMLPVVGASTTAAALALLGGATSTITTAATATIELLRLATTATLIGSQCFVMGFSAVADGGGGLFAVKSSDTTSADNGGTIFVDASNRRWYRENGQGLLNLFWFGGNALADYSPALMQALAVATTLSATLPGVGIIIPAGSLTFASQAMFNYPATPFSLAIRGIASDASVLTWTSTGGLVLNMTIPQHTIHMSDMTIACGSQGTSSGITCNQTTPQGPFGQNEFENITFRGSDSTVLHNYWNKALDIHGLGNINFDGLLVYGRGVDATTSLGFGVIVNGLTSGPDPFGIVYNFTDCSFWELGIGIEYGTNVQGMAVTACNFTNGNQGIFQPTSALAGSQLAVSNSQFNCFSNGIIQGGILNNISVSNSLFFVAPTGASGIALAGSGAQHTFIGNVMSTFGAPQPGTNGINITGAALANGTGTITGNTFQAFETGVNLSGAGNFYVQGNRYVGCTNEVINPGSNTVGTATN